MQASSPSNIQQHNQKKQDKTDKAKQQVIQPQIIKVEKVVKNPLLPKKDPLSKLFIASKQTPSKPAAQLKSETTGKEHISKQQITKTEPKIQKKQQKIEQGNIPTNIKPIQQHKQQISIPSKIEEKLLVAKIQSEQVYKKQEIAQPNINRQPNITNKQINQKINKQPQNELKQPQINAKIKQQNNKEIKVEENDAKNYKNMDKMLGSQSVKQDKPEEKKVKKNVNVKSLFGFQPKAQAKNEETKDKKLINSNIKYSKQQKAINNQQISAKKEDKLIVQKQTKIQKQQSTTRTQIKQESKKSQNLGQKQIKAKQIHEQIHTQAIIQQKQLQNGQQLNNKIQKDDSKQPQSQQIKEKIVQKINQPNQQHKTAKHQVQIKIIGSVQKGSALSKYMVYTIQGKDKHGPYQISRKYGEFQSLRKLIRQRWPGCFIPAIHNKSQIQKQDEKQKQIRLVLENFILGLSYSQHLYYKEQVQLFLRSPDIDIAQMAKQMPALKAKDVISRYISCFGQQMFQDKSDITNSTIIKSFTISLKKIISSLAALANKALILCQSYDNYHASLAKFNQIQRHYQQLWFTNSQKEKTIILKDTSNTVNKLKDLMKNNPFYLLYSFLSSQARDAQSFVEIIIASQLFVLRKDDIQEQIKQIQQQLMMIAEGHKTLKTITTRKSKAEVKAELQITLQKLLQQKQLMVDIFNVTEIVLAKKQINFFKTFKIKNYQKVIAEWISLAGASNPQLQQLWRFIQDSSMNLLKQNQ